MDQKQKERRLYQKPQVQVIGVEPYCSLLAGSNLGGHNSAGDDGNDLNAKRGFFLDDEVGGDFNMWED